MEFTYRPIVVWPGTMTANHKRAAFRASYNATLQLLDRELLKIGAKYIVLQVALTDSEIRLDGRPRADARPRHPGVILSFDSCFDALSYPCDTFTTWEDNLRAIALALEALRTVERFGVTNRGEQYQGWTALSPPNPPMTKDEAIAFLRRFQQPGDTMNDTYRRGMGQLHPDRNGGKEGPFKQLQEAKDVLGL